MSSANIGAWPEEQLERGTGEPRHSDPAAVGAAQETGRRRTRNVLHVLGNREFALFWSGQTISQSGTWMQQFAQGWVVTTLAGSALALASVNFAASIPMLILLPFGGVVADRMGRRRILLVTQSVMAVLAVLLGVLIQVYHLRLWHIWLIALLLGLATAYDLPAYESFYPQLVETEDLLQAISLNQATFHCSRIVGPAIASWFVALWGMAADTANSGRTADSVATNGSHLGKPMCLKDWRRGRDSPAVKDRTPEPAGRKAVPWCAAHGAAGRAKAECNILL